MSVVGYSVQYSDLLNTMVDSLAFASGNVGSAYKSWVPAELRYPHSFGPFTISAPQGHSPSITWNNSASLAVVSKETLVNDFNNFLTTNHLDAASIGTAIIGPDVVVRFLTAAYSYIATRFVLVYSPYTVHTAVFFIPSLVGTIDPSAIVDISPLPVTTGNVQTIVNAVTTIATSRLRTFYALGGYTVTGA